MKKKVKAILILLTVLAMGIANTKMNANAEEFNNDSIDDLLKFQKNNNEHENMSSLVGFAVNSQGDVAIGSQDYYINVYDNKGNFIYSYNFDYYGGYVFEFDEEDNIVICPARGEERYYYNSNAELLHVKKFSSSSEKSNYYQSLYINKITRSNKNYELVQSFFTDKVIETDEYGNKIIIYEKSYYLIRLTRMFMSLIFVLIAIIAITSYILGVRKKYKDNLNNQ